jgi:hypothetical protein
VVIIIPDRSLKRSAARVGNGNGTAQGKGAPHHSIHCGSGGAKDAWEDDFQGGDSCYAMRTPYAGVGYGHDDHWPTKVAAKKIIHVVRRFNRQGAISAWEFSTTHNLWIWDGRGWAITACGTRAKFSIAEDVEPEGCVSCLECINATSGG